jgi:hypothetical protein
VVRREETSNLFPTMHCVSEVEERFFYTLLKVIMEGKFSKSRREWSIVRDRSEGEGMKSS